MRPTLLVFAPIFVAFALASCQDSYSSNSERDTHMGDIRAAAPAPEPSAPPATPPAFVAPPPPAGSVPAATGLPAPKGIALPGASASH